jgi:hypothetical protein
VNIVKFLHQNLFLDRRFSSDAIQKVCGILDTNCYELGWNGVRARAMYRTIARINHDCVPNARKFFNRAKKVKEMFGGFFSVKKLHNTRCSYVYPCRIRSGDDTM